MKSLLLAACCLLCFAAWPQGAAAEEAVPPAETEGVGEEQLMPGESSGADGEEVPEAEDDRSVRFIAYVAADQRLELVDGHVSSLSALYKQTWILWQFGLASMEQVQLLQGEYEKALSDREQWTMARDEALAALMESMESHVPHQSARASRGTLDPEMPLSPGQGGEAFQALRQAMAKANETERELHGAQIQHRSGILSLEKLLAAHQAAYQAKLAAAEAKESYYQSMLDHLAETTEGKPATWIGLIGEIARDDPALIREWLESWRRTAADGRSAEEADIVVQSGEFNGFRQLPPDSLAIMAPGTVWVHPVWAGTDGEVYVPLRACAEALGYEVTWDPSTGQITLNRGEYGAQLVAGNKAVVNGDELEWGSPAFIVRGQTHVPLSFVAVVLQADPYWNDEMEFGMIIP